MRRSIWGQAVRVVAGLVGMLAVALGWGAAAAGLSALGAPRLLSSLVAMALAVLLSLAVAEALSRKLEGRSLLRERLLAGAGARGGLWGAAAAVTAVAAVFALQWALGWIRIEGTGSAARGAGASLSGLAGGLLVFLGVGFSEELVFRGYLLDVLSRGRSLWAAAIIDGLLFALLHLLGGYPGALATALLLISGVIFTLLMTAGRQLTGALWWSMGWHAAWDWAQDDLFGLGTVGEKGGPHALLQLSQHGPALWVGRPPVIECGLLYVAAELLALAAVLWLGRRAAPR